MTYNLHKLSNCKNLILKNKLFKTRSVISSLSKPIDSAFEKHYYSITKLFNNTEKGNNITIEKRPVEDWNEVLSRWYKRYQEFVGISEILKAQERVTELTNNLFEVQTLRRKLQKDVNTVNIQLLETHQHINKSELYSDEHKILFEKARQLNFRLKTLQDEFAEKEESERDLFTHLTNAIKFCHEKEQAHQQQSKYWSIMISVVSAALASFITSLNNWIRIKEIKDHVTQQHTHSITKSTEYLNNISNTFLPDIQEFIKKEITNLSNSLPSPVDTSTTISTNVQKSKDVGYLKIMSSMVMGAIIGTLVTALFIGAGGE